MLAKLTNNFIRVTKETSFLWLTSLAAIGISSFWSDINSDVIIICDKNKKNKDIIENCPTIRKKKYYPTKYLPMALPMIIYGEKILKPKRIRYE